MMVMMMMMFRCIWRCRTAEATVTGCVCATVWKCSATQATIAVRPAQCRYSPLPADQSPSTPLPPSGQLGGWRPPSSSGTNSARTPVAWQSFCCFPRSGRHCKLDNANVKVTELSNVASELKPHYVDSMTTSNLLRIKQTTRIQFQNPPHTPFFR